LGSLDHGPRRGGDGPVPAEEDQAESQLHEDDGLTAAGLAAARDELRPVARGVLGSHLGRPRARRESDLLRGRERRRVGRGLCARAGLEGEHQVEGEER
jgi:hypothetical protein